MAFLVLVLGLVVGSFLNVLIYRLNTEGAPSPLFGRSFCPHCRHKLAAKDLFPLLSFLVLKGHCRYCHQPIGASYPLVELATGLLFLGVLIFFPHPSPWSLVKDLVFVSAMLVIFASDLIYGFIPDEMVIVLFFLALARSWPNLLSWPNILSGVVPAVVLATMIVLSGGRAMGWGDVKLIFVLGWLFSFPGVLIFLWVSFILGGLVSLVLLALQHKHFGDTIALGPYLVIGAVLVYFYGAGLSSQFTWLYSY